MNITAHNAWEPWNLKKSLWAHRSGIFYPFFCRVVLFLRLPSFFLTSSKKGKRKEKKESISALSMFFLPIPSVFTMLSPILVHDLLLKLEHVASFYDEYEFICLAGNYECQVYRFQQVHIAFSVVAE